MARDKGGQGMKAPPVAKYRKNIGTYQRDSTKRQCVIQQIQNKDQVPFATVKDKH